LIDFLKHSDVWALGPVPVETAIGYAVQSVAGLEGAHKRA